MFAVPGWGVTPALLKKQIDQSVTSNTAPRKAKEEGGSRKRKRGTAKINHEIKDEDVGALWEQHIEGKAPPPTVKEPATTKAAKPKEPKQDGETKVGAADGPEQEEALSAPKATHVTKAPKNNAPEGESSKTKRRKKQREEAAQRKEQGVDADAEIPGESSSDTPLEVASIPAAVATPAALKLTPLQAAMRQKLTSARFRHLNQTLYTAPSTESMDLFKANPTFFEEYHSGFRQQVSAWPENPVNSFVLELKERGKVRVSRQVDRFRASQGQGGKEKKDKSEGNPLPRNGGTCMVADLGCGDAALGKDIARVGAKMKIKVLSYDLYSQNPHVIRADISKLPLKDGEVNIAIFCLALMGTNWIDFIEEAWRILHWKGELWIAEIKSRFNRGKQDRVVDHSVGKKRKLQNQQIRSKADDRHEQAEHQEQLAVEVDGSESKSATDVSSFVEVLRRRGFALQSEEAIDMSNKMFVKMKFTKSLSPVKGKNQARATMETTATGEKVKKFVDEQPAEAFDEKSVLKPCLYKLR